MRRFALKYLVLRTLSTVAGVLIIAANLVLWHVPPDDLMGNQGYFNRALLLGFQTFLFAYFGFLIADSVSRFWWNRWRPVDANAVVSKGIIIEVAGGNRISGVMHEPAAANGAPNSLGLVIASYGFNDNQFRANHVVQAIAAAGFSVLSWDYRGRGATRGRITDLEGHVADLKSLIEHFARPTAGDGRPIFLLGWSVGGMVSIHAGLHDEKVRKIFAWSTWSDLRRRVLWRIYANPFALLRYLFKGGLLHVSRETNEMVSPIHYFESLARDLGGKDKVAALAREKLFLCHARNDTLVGFDNFEENSRWLRLPPANYLTFKKGSHLMLRKEPVLIGLACRHFSGGVVR
ncbi:MAG: alpha/beta fold hydrolase [Candidatus Lokiarchaeota archaeon]|nr:alpha/beta fold hydrolase [Candidatus Lokiarchaeota archaeon]